VNWGIV